MSSRIISVSEADLEDMFHEWLLCSFFCRKFNVKTCKNNAIDVEKITSHSKSNTVLIF